PDVVRTGTLTRSDGLLLVMGNTNPRFSKFLRRIIDLASAFLMMLIAITIWPELIEAWETNHFFGTPGIFTAPWWPVRLAMVFSAVMCSLLWLCKAFGDDAATDEITEAPDSSTS
ncbi:MAG: TRAP transporter small permease, partial [Pseudomonadota bacterium]